MIGTVLGSLGLQGAINVQTTVHEGPPQQGLCTCGAQAPRMSCSGELSFALASKE
jgi:hypothetical protein